MVCFLTLFYFLVDLLPPRFILRQFCCDDKMRRVNSREKAAKSSEKGLFGCDEFPSSSSVHHQHHRTRSISYHARAAIAWWDATIFLVKEMNFWCNKWNKHMNNNKKSKYTRFQECSKVDYEAVALSQAARFLKTTFAAEVSHCSCPERVKTCFALVERVLKSLPFPFAAATCSFSGKRQKN